MSTPAARVAAQAKVNLALQVGPRGDDGYHDLATVFARIDLADDVLVTPLPRGLTLRVMRDGVPDERFGSAEKNLAVLAARAYMNAAQWPAGCAIQIDKRIPVGAGLGGGSADAGAVLRALDALAPRPLAVDDLLRIAATLGADVPFLTLDAPMALGTARGDVLEVLPAVSGRWLALVLPTFSIATADAYGWLDAARPDSANLTRLDPASLRRASRNWHELAAVATNDFQPVIAGRHPMIDSYRDALRAAGAHIAMLSGSGSAVFGVFEEQPDVAGIARACNTSVILARVPARVVAPFRSE